MDIIAKLFPQLAKNKEEILDSARQEAKNVLIKAKEEALSLRASEERKLSEITKQSLELEKKFVNQEADLRTQRTEVEKEQARLQSRRGELEREKSQLEKKREELLEKFERLSKLTADEARQLVLNSWENKLQRQLSQRVTEVEQQIKQTADEKAKEILLDAMRYGVTDYVTEYTLSTLMLPGDEYKGRIIGKEGRNIRAFELATGVEVDLDEEGVVKLSSFDPVKREIARITLEQLIKDGRIQPSRIEELVAKNKQEVDRLITKAGEKLCHDMGVYNLPSEIVSLLGRYKYRFSYGQNMIQHTMEETQIGVALAHELGADVQMVRLACLLHDIGKVITDKEGSHIQLGVDLLKRYGFPQKIINAVASHHEDTPFDSSEAVIVYLADAISGGRPGARREDVTSYIQRMQDMETLIKKHEGVADVYVLQAGREIRVIVNPEALNDEQTTMLCEKVRDDLAQHFSMIPGQLKVTAVREFRTVAKTRN